MKFILANLCLLYSFSVFSQIQITHQDLNTIIGSWQGNITYLDYQTNKPFTLSANLIVEKGKNENHLILKNIYPDEPKANYTNRIKITKDGAFLNKHSVTKRERLVNGQLEIQTEHMGKDDNRTALIRYVYHLGHDLFLIRKEVQFNPDGNWIKRSEFSYKRINKADDKE